MADISVFTFTGRVGADAEVKTVGNGKVLTQLSVAVNTGYGDYKKTTWLTVKVWGERGANAAPLFKKGALVAGSGEAILNEYTGKDGVAHANIEVTCLNVQLLVGKKEGSPSRPMPSGEEGTDIPF